MTAYTPQAVPQIARDIADDARSGVVAGIASGLGLFTTVHIEFADCRRKMGRYVRGTATEPRIILDWQVIRASAQRHSVDYETAIVTTILHELGHAIQEALGLPFRERQAETFARRLWQDDYLTPLAEWTPARSTS